MFCFKVTPSSVSFIRKYSAKVKPAIVPDKHVIDNINNNVFKPKKHPGIMKPKTVLVPETLIKAVVNATEDSPVKALITNGQYLEKHLKGRVPPMEHAQLRELTQKIKQRVSSKYKDVVINNEQDEARVKQMVESRVQNILKEKVYNWKPIKYDAYRSLLYLMARFAPEYSVLVKIFGEICSRDPEFKPRSFFDFGSGVGTATWAANVYWKHHIFEYYNVDASSDMNDLAQILLQGGRGTGKMPTKGVFYRQFLPATKITFDLVISAYSLLELPSMQARLQTVLNLWNKTEKYLVIVEQGTNAGFKVVNEVRDFILDIKKESNIGHVFSPCPHDDTCPRFLLDDGTPCNFEVNYYTLPIGQISQNRRELYSYVILKKGKRNETDPKWPRPVRPALVRARHTICRICTANGKLDEVIFTAAKHGKITYHCARSSEWGDLLPVEVNVNLETDEHNPKSDKSGICNKLTV
ncbi:hypothetical protein NQ317_008626 [Molorchus minor]|uniref:Methyltransferase-like protein 17, mitochondrial n=1 Tax=Molorchus minor TaxID=1323400 RepID=A0ABQ9IZQ3_9CUCU|nr:hypothetical protein NQ317_008626 [Molorchus minor]